MSGVVGATIERQGRSEISTGAPMMGFVDQYCNFEQTAAFNQQSVEFLRPV